MCQCNFLVIIFPADALRSQILSRGRAFSNNNQSAGVSLISWHIYEHGIPHICVRFNE